MHDHTALCYWIWNDLFTLLHKVRRAVHQPCRVFDHTQTLRKTICKCRNQDYECRAVSEGHTAKCIPPRKLPVTKMTKKELCALGGGAELVGELLILLEKSSELCY